MATSLPMLRRFFSMVLLFGALWLGFVASWQHPHGVQAHELAAPGTVTVQASLDHAADRSVPAPLPDQGGDDHRVELEDNAVDDALGLPESFVVELALPLGQRLRGAVPDHSSHRPALELRPPIV